MVPGWAIENAMFFAGLPTKDVDEWLQHFKWLAEANHWNENMKCLQFPISLKEAAKSWYDTLDITWKREYMALKEGIRIVFKKMDLQSVSFQELIDRRQRKDESVSNYAFAKLALCNRVNRRMSEKEKLQHFIQELLSMLQVAISIIFSHEFHGRTGGCQKERECVETWTKMEQRETKRYQKRSRVRVIDR